MKEENIYNTTHMKKLTATKRDVKTSTKKIRDDGFVPGVVYKKGMENIIVSVPSNKVHSLWKDIKDKQEFILDIEGTEYPVVLQDIDVHVTSGEILNMDFLAQ